MILKCVSVKDVLDVNAYFYISEKTNHGFLIDPGAEASTLIKEIQNNNWVIEKILLTHGHFDHIGAVDQLFNVLNIPYFIHVNGAEYLQNAGYNLSMYFGRDIVRNAGGKRFGKGRTEHYMGRRNGSGRRQRGQCDRQVTDIPCARFGSYKFAARNGYEPYGTFGNGHKRV